MKKASLVPILAAILLMTGCPHPTNPEPNKEESDLLTLEVTSAGMEYISISYFFNGTEKTEGWEFWLYQNENDTNFITWCWEPKTNPYKFENLIPGHEYTLKVKFTDENNKTYCSTKKVSTKPKAVPEIEGKFVTDPDETYVKISWKELGSFTKKVELYRSDTETGKYDFIETDVYYIDHIKDKTAEDKKTYWYKIKTYELISESTGEEDKYKLIGESKPIDLATGTSIPKPIAADSITSKKGITTLSFTWPQVEGALKYNVWLTDGSIYSPTTLDSKEVTENSVTFTNLQPAKNYEFNITVTTEGGTSSNTFKKFSTSKAAFPTSSDYDYYSYTVKVEADQTSAVYSFKVPFEDTTGCSVNFSLRKNTEADSELIQDIGELKNYKFLRENLSPATWYSSSSYDTNTAGFIHMTVTYINKDNEDETKDSWLKVDSFYTRNLNPPTNLQVTSISKTEATISFDELTEDEKLGKTPTYDIYAYDKDGNLARSETGNLISTHGTSSPLTLQNLIKGTEYVFKATTTYSGATSSAPKESTSIIANTASGIEQKPVVTLTEVDPGNSEWPFKTYIKADWEPLEAAEGVVPQNLVYGLEYRIFEHNRYTRPQTGVSPALTDKTYTGTSSFSEKILVNRGNQYTVRVYAYDKDEPGDIVYSDPVKIQLKHMEDRQMHGALTYTDWFEEYANEENVKAGDVVEFTNPKVWKGDTDAGTEIRSVTGMYNAGYIQLFGEVESTKWLFPSRDGYAFVSFKFNFEKAIKAPAANNVTCVPKLILFDRDCFNFQYSTYGYIDAVYFVVPDEDGHIVKQYTDKEEPYIFETFNMPYFQNNKTSTHPSQAGLEVDESYVFNNSVYMGVSQVTAGDIAFSYYY